MRPFTGPVPFVLAAALFLPAAASAATVNIGAVNEIRGGMGPTEPTGGGDAVQISETTGTYAVPATLGRGVITAWEHRAGSAAGRLTFKVYRPLGAGRFFTVASDAQMVTAGAAHTFVVRIPVRAGDRLGLSSPTDTVHLAYQTFVTTDQFAFLPPDSNPAAGSTVTQDGPPAMGYRLAVAARVETDADGDGFGDDSQDRCPADPSRQSPCEGGSPLPRFSGCSPRAVNVIRGTAAGNVITGASARDRIYGEAGNDIVDGAGNHDCIDLGAGRDRGKGGSGSDILRGASGPDRLGGGSGNDRMSGGSSGDRLTGDSGRDRLDGGSGNDRMSGGSSGDRLAGGSGSDRISAGSGNDRINTRDRRRDRVSCGRGRDRVVADRGDRVSRDCERVSRR